MVERKIELNRRQRRRRKMFKLKKKLATAKDGREKENILRKIHFLSPWWREPGSKDAKEPAKEHKVEKKGTKG